MKYINQLSISELQKLLSKLGYILLDNENNTNLDENFLEEWHINKKEDFCFLKCIKKENEVEEEDFKKISKLLKAFLPFPNLENFQDYVNNHNINIIKLDDFTICELMEQDYSKSKQLQSILINKFGKRYYKDLQKFYHELKSSMTFKEQKQEKEESSQEESEILER